MDQYMLQACAHHSAMQVLYVNSGHVVFEIEERKKVGLPRKNGQ
jgi:hypothetical protein